MSLRMMTLPRRGERGFTLVELLITVVIIAILTAIAVPAYITVVANAQDSAAKQVLSSVATAEEIASFENSINGGGGYLAKTEMVSNGVLALGESADVLTGDGCWVAGSKSDTGKTFYATTRGPISTNGVTVPDTSWCVPATGLFNSPITNLATNPRVSGLSTWAGLNGGGSAGIGSQATIGPWGGRDFVMTWSTAASSTGGPYFSTPGLTAGKTYTSSVWVYTNVAQTLRQAIEWKAGTTYISVSSGLWVDVPANTWKRLSSTAVAPAGATAATSTAYSRPVAPGHMWQAGEYVRATAAMFTEGSTVHTFADSGTPGWTANPDGTSTGFPYTIDSVAGSPLVVLAGVSSDVISDDEIDDFGSRTAYALFDRVSIPTAADLTVIVDIQQLTANMSGVVRASNGTGGQYNFRPQFDGGGGASGAYNLVEPAASGLGQNIITISADFESKTARLATATGESTRSALDTGTGGWPQARFKLNDAASDKAVAGFMYLGTHSAATEAKVKTWIQQNYGFVD